MMESSVDTTYPREQAGLRRGVTWIVLTAIAFPLSGLASLYLVAVAASSLAPGLTARENVIAVQVVVWSVLASASGLLLGRLTVGWRQPRALAFVVAAATAIVGVFVAWAISATERAEAGHVDVDALGSVAGLPVTLLAVAVSTLCLSVSTEPSTGAWRVVLSAASAVTLLLAGVALVQGSLSPALVATGMAAVAAAATAWRMPSTDADPC